MDQLGQLVPFDRSVRGVLVAQVDRGVLFLRSVLGVRWVQALLLHLVVLAAR